MDAPPLHHCPDQLSLCHWHYATTVHGLLSSESYHLESVVQSGTVVRSEADVYAQSGVTTAVAPLSLRIPDPERTLPVCCICNCLCSLSLSVLMSALLLLLHHLLVLALFVSYHLSQRIGGRLYS